MKALHLLLFFVICFRANAQSVEKETDNSPIFTTAVTSPVFPGGVDSLKAYLKKNVKYPEVFLGSGKKEIAAIQVIVEKDGRVSGIRFMGENPTKCPQEFLDEAERVALNMPRWSPAKNGSKLVRCYFVLPIKFCPEGCTE
jgi:protein TonB